MNTNKYEIRDAAAEFATLSRAEQKNALFGAADRARMNTLRALLIAAGAF